VLFVHCKVPLEVVESVVFSLHILCCSPVLCEAVMLCGRYDVLSRLPTSLSELTAESAGLSHLM